MVVAGYYLAITQSQDPNQVQPVDTLAERSHQVSPLQIDDETVDTAIRGVRFVYAPLDTRRSALNLRQESRASEGEGDSVGLRTQIALNFDEALALRKDLPKEDDDSDDDSNNDLSDMIGVAPASASTRDVGAEPPAALDALAATRTYVDVWAAVHTEQKENSGTLGKDISAQVANLLEGSITRTFLQPNGENIGFEWHDVPNPEARRILYLVRDAQAFLTPRYTADALNPGDTWSYERPLWVDPDDKKMHAEGTVTILNRFVGTLDVDGRHLGVIRQTLEGHAEGELRATTSTQFTMKGSGSGVFLVDIERGNRVAADLEFERTLTVEGAVKAGGAPAVQSSTISLNLRPENGIKLPETLRVAREIEDPEPAAATP